MEVATTPQLSIFFKHDIFGVFALPTFVVRASYWKGFICCNPPHCKVSISNCLIYFIKIHLHLHLQIHLHKKCIIYPVSVIL